MTFEDVFVPNKNKLEYAVDFEKSTASVLLSSRVSAASGLTGTAIGAYEECLRYCLKRKQFGRPIAGF
jgi:alkylation response protein AidB-like acyl-CoA dehydrogenase